MVPLLLTISIMIKLRSSVSASVSSGNLASGCFVSALCGKQGPHGSLPWDGSAGICCFIVSRTDGPRHF